jgi:hypothetical protein
MNFNQGKNKNQHIGGLKPHPTVKYILTKDIFEKVFYFLNHYLHSVAIRDRLIPYTAWYGGEHEPQPKK